MVGDRACTRVPALAAVARRTRIVGGNFALRFEGPGAFPRALGAWYAAQDRLGTHYGDSAMFARASAFRALGAFPVVEVLPECDQELAGQGHDAGLPLACVALA